MQPRSPAIILRLTQSAKCERDSSKLRNVLPFLSVTPTSSMSMNAQDPGRWKRVICHSCAVLAMFRTAFQLGVTSL